MTMGYLQWKKTNELLFLEDLLEKVRLVLKMPALVKLGVCETTLNIVML